MTSPLSSTPTPAAPAKPVSFIRFTLDQRVEHVLLLVAFSLLGLTGLVQKFSQVAVSQWLIALMGGIEIVRIIHRINAVLMTAESIYHLAATGYRLYVMRVSLTMLPGVSDVIHVIQDVLCYLGLRQHTAHYGRYNYAEKAEYWAMIWGTVVMGITGFLLWNPIAAARLLPGEFIPAAKAAHGGEAILAVLAILLWHFYHVHLKHLNKSMFLGRMTRDEMKHEHPAELAHLETLAHAPAAQPAPMPPEERRRRQTLYLPVAAVFVIVLSVGLFWLTSFEESAIITIPQGETAKIYVPYTPTPSPVPTLTPTPLPAGAGPATWETGLGQLFTDRCGSCHGAAKAGGLSVQTYAETVTGGNRGAGVVLGNPDNSSIVQVQTAGGHPGMFSADELAQIVQWIKVGAPEK